MNVSKLVEGLHQHKNERLERFLIDSEDMQEIAKFAFYVHKRKKRLELCFNLYILIYLHWSLL